MFDQTTPVIDRLDDNLAILKYIHARYTIELLRKTDMKAIDAATTYMYAHEYGLPWKNDLNGIIKFRALNPNGIMHNYIASKMRSKLADLFTKVEESKDSGSAVLGLTPSTINSVNAAMGWLKINDKYNTGTSELLKTFELIDNSNVLSVLTEMETVDNMLRSIFNTYTDKYRTSEEDKEKIGVHRHEIRQHLQYLDLKKLLPTDVNGLSFDHFGVRIKTLLAIVSILYHLSYPSGIHPNRLDRLYEKYILRREDAAEALQNVRHISMLSPEAISCTPFSMINKLHPSYSNDDKLWDTLTEDPYHTKQFAAKDSLEEKYLVTFYLLNK